MFEDRNNNNYAFSKYDKHARTQVMIDEKQAEGNSQAYKTLFAKETPRVEKQNVDILGRVKKNELQDTQKQNKLSNIPSSAYLKQFENKIVTDVDQLEEGEVDIKEEDNIDFSKLIDISDNIEVTNNHVRSEIKKINSEPQKRFSFRIKLVTGVYCILVALFGGWVIGNTIDLIQTNNNLNNAITQTEETSVKISDVLIEMEKLDQVSPEDRKDDSLLVKITTETIAITPEKIEEPNEYEKSSNWYDVICNSISGIFGGK